MVGYKTKRISLNTTITCSTKQSQCLARVISIILLSHINGKIMKLKKTMMNTISKKQTLFNRIEIKAEQPVLLMPKVLVIRKQ